MVYIVCWTNDFFLSSRTWDWTKKIVSFIITVRCFYKNSIDIQDRIHTIVRIHIESELVSVIQLIRLKEVEINRTIYLLCPIWWYALYHQWYYFLMQSNMYAIPFLLVNMKTSRYGFHQSSTLPFEKKETWMPTINEFQICTWNDKNKNLTINRKTSSNCLQRKCCFSFSNLWL